MASNVGVLTLADRESTNPPELGPPFCPTVTSSPSVFIRFLRSEDRLVTVTGTLFKILFLGVSNPHPLLGAVLFPSVPRNRTGGVILPLLTGVNLPVFVRAPPTIGLVVSPLLPDPGVPTMTKLAAIAAEVTRAMAVG
jgi:hypothetical protein